HARFAGGIHAYQRHVAEPQVPCKPERTPCTVARVDVTGLLADAENRPEPPQPPLGSAARLRFIVSVQGIYTGPVGCNAHARGVEQPGLAGDVALRATTSGSAQVGAIGL